MLNELINVLLVEAYKVAHQSADVFASTLTAKQSNATNQFED